MCFEHFWTWIIHGLASSTKYFQATYGDCLLLDISVLDLVTVFIPQWWRLDCSMLVELYVALMQGVLLCLQPSRKSVKCLVGFNQILLHRHFKITPHRLNENCAEILKQPLTPISSMFINQCVCFVCAWECVSYNYLECSLIYTCVLCVCCVCLPYYIVTHLWVLVAQFSSAI